MQTTFALSALLSILPAFVAASPLEARQGETRTFGLITTHSGNQNVHLRSVNANSRQFWIGRPTTTFCPEGVDCPTGDSTVFVGNGNRISTSHLVPGEQSVYVAGADQPTPGALQFNAAHASPPTGSFLDNFLLTQDDLQWLNGNFYACPAMGAYYITTIPEPTQLCIDVGLHVVEYNGPTPAVWQYE